MKEEVTDDMIDLWHTLEEEVDHQTGDATSTFAAKPLIMAAVPGEMIGIDRTIDTTRIAVMNV